MWQVGDYKKMVYVDKSIKNPNDVLGFRQFYRTFYTCGKNLGITVLTKEMSSWKLNLKKMCR